MTQSVKTLKKTQSLKSVPQPPQDYPVIIYEPDSEIRHPLRLLKEMWDDLLSSRDLAWQLLQRDIQAQYRQSFLGIFWAFIPPLVAALGLTYLQKSGIANFGETDIPYPVFILFSMTLWRLYSQILTGVMGGLKQATGIRSKLKVPPEAFILSSIGKILFNFAIQIVLVAFFFIWFKIKITWAIILAPVALVHLMVLATGIGLILGPVSTLYGDVQKISGFAIQAWLFITPVIYETPEGWWSIIVNLNPVTPLLVTVRELATTGQITNPIGFWLASFFAFICLFIGWFFSRLSMPFIVERS